jgi:hypothetical protein
MGLFKKIGLHLGDKYIATQIQGMNMGKELTKDANNVVQVAGFMGGLLVGSAVGIARVWNPFEIADSFLTPEKDMEERINKKIESASSD